MARPGGPAMSSGGIGRAARCLPWQQVLFRAAFPRTTLAPFSARGSLVTYAVAWAGCPWMASWQARQTMRVLRRILVILAAQAGCPGRSPERVVHQAPRAN